MMRIFKHPRVWEARPRSAKRGLEALRKPQRSHREAGFPVSLCTGSDMIGSARSRSRARTASDDVAPWLDQNFDHSEKCERLLDS